MENLYPIFISIAVPLIGGIIAIFIAYYHLQKVDRIGKNGIKTEGVVFDVIVNQDILTRFVDANTDNSHVSNSDYTNTLVIRFVTEKKEWITEKSEISYSGYEKGDKVNVIYNPDNPSEFILASEKKFGWLAYIAILAGVLSTLFGLYKLVIYLIS